MDQTELGFRLRTALEAIGSDHAVIIEGAVSIPPDDALAPDLVLTSTPRGPRGIPVETVLLMVDVSDSAPDYDLGPKAPIYARAGIAGYWIIANDSRAIIQLSAPGADGHAPRRDLAYGEPIAAATIPGPTIETTGP